MTALHRTTVYLRWSQAQRKRLLAMLPSPCPRCALPMYDTQRLDLGHIVGIDVRPDLAMNPSNVRLEHAGCNRRDGQRKTVAKRRRNVNGKRLPAW